MSALRHASTNSRVRSNVIATVSGGSLNSFCSRTGDGAGFHELRTRTTKAVIDILSGRKPADCLNPQVLEGLA